MQAVAETIPEAQLVTLQGVAHLAPLQRPARFNDALQTFLAGTASCTSARPRSLGCGDDRNEELA